MTPGYSSSKVILSVVAQMAIKKKRYGISSAQSISIRGTFSCYSRPPSATTFSSRYADEEAVFDRLLSIRPDDARDENNAGGGGPVLESRYPPFASI